jgi:hypothetical protein
LFIELWGPLRDLSHENNMAASNDMCQMMINDTLVDLGNEYDFEFLRRAKDYTCTANDQVVSLDNIYTLSAAGIVYAYCTASADAGTFLQVFGKRINSDNTYDLTSETLTLAATATATGGISWSHIDRFRKTGTAGAVVAISSGGTELGRLSASQTELSNDFNKIGGVYDITNNREISQMDKNVIYSGSPTLQYSGTPEAWDYDSTGSIQLFNVVTNTVIKIIYQALPKVLNANMDWTEFPRNLWPGIIQAAYMKMLRYTDESDGTQAYANYRNKIKEVVDAWICLGAQGTMGRSRVLPVGARRKL